MKNKTLNRCYKLAKPHLKTIFLVSIISIIIDIFELAKPYLVKVVIDDFLSYNISQKAFFSISSIGIIYLVIVVLGNILDYFARMKTNIMGEDVLYSLRNKLYKYTQDASIIFHDKTPSGKLYARITNDIDDISAFFKDVITTVFKDVISILSVIAIMIYFSLKLSLLSLIVIPFVIITSVLLTKILNKIYDVSKVVRTNLNTFLAESIYGAKIIKIFNIQEEKQKECEEYTQDFLKKEFLQVFMKVFSQE